MVLEFEDDKNSNFMIFNQSELSEFSFAIIHKKLLSRIVKKLAFLIVAVCRSNSKRIMELSI